jgi:hypothetical protein
MRSMQRVQINDNSFKIFVRLSGQRRFETARFGLD